jgi:hypothetical protein
MTGDMMKLRKAFYPVAMMTLVFTMSLLKSAKKIFRRRKMTKPYMHEYIGTVADIKLTIKFKGKKHKVDVKAEATAFCNDGIGAYEFWGARGYDSGNDICEEFEILSVTPVKKGSRLSSVDLDKIKNIIYRDEDLYTLVSDGIMDMVESRKAEEENKYYEAEEREYAERMGKDQQVEV